MQHIHTIKSHYLACKITPVADPQHADETLVPREGVTGRSTGTTMSLCVTIRGGPARHMDARKLCPSVPFLQVSLGLCLSTLPCAPEPGWGGALFLSALCRAQAPTQSVTDSVKWPSEAVLRLLGLSTSAPPENNYPRLQKLQGLN